MSSDHQSMKRGHIHATPTGLHVEPPQWEGGEEPLFRVMCIIDLGRYVRSVQWQAACPSRNTV